MPTNPDSNLSTLAQIQQKVRKLTLSPSADQLSDSDLNNYINTFILYDFPEHLRTFKLRQQFTFYCTPYQDTYVTDTSWPMTNVLYNFSNIYTTIHSPVYIAGYNSFFSQSPEQFFGIYPLTNSIVLQNTGNGVATNFTGTITNLQGSIAAPGVTQSTALLQNNVLFSSLDSNLNGLSLVDSPIIDSTTGFNTVYGVMYDPNNPPALPLKLAAPYTNQAGFPSNNFVNYATGQYNVTFTSAPGSNASINAQTVPQVISLPQAMLWYENKFTLRPVPDQPYRINFEVYVRPTELLNSTDMPELAEWWQFVSYGSSIKLLQDRGDHDTVALLMPEYKNQERLCLRRTIVQYTNERTATIYTEQANIGAGAYGSGWGMGGGQF